MSNLYEYDVSYRISVENVAFFLLRELLFAYILVFFSFRIS